MAKNVDKLEVGPKKAYSRQTGYLVGFDSHSDLQRSFCKI